MAKDAVTAAIAATDAELFASALGNEAAVHDDTNDRSLEQQDDGLEGKVEDLGEDTEVETEAAAEDAAGDGKAEVEAADEGADKGPKKDPATGKFVRAEGDAAKDDKADKGLVPSHVVREKTAQVKAAEERATAAEARVAEADRRLAEVNGKLDLLSRQFEDSRKPPVVADKKEALVRPDKFADPDGYDKWVEDTIARAVGEVKREAQETQDAYTKRVVNMNLAATHEVHKEKFEQAYQAILEDAPKNPETKIAIQRIWNSDNPGAELMKWHRRQTLLRDFGDDPEAEIQKRIEAALEIKLKDPEFRKQYIAGLRSDASGQNTNGAARHVTRAAVPARQIPSLNGASGSAQLSDTTFDDQSDDAFFERALQRPAG